MMKVLSVVNHEDTPFNVLLVGEDEDMVVKFYDGRYNHTEYGQFITSYYASTILEHEDGYGLHLDMGVPSWKVSSYNMIQIKEFIENIV